MNWLSIGFTFFLLSASVWVVYRHHLFRSPLSSLTVVSFLLIKIFFGWLLTWYYLNHTADLMKADVFKYFYDADVLHAVLQEHPVIWLKIFAGTDTQSPAVFAELNKTEFYYAAGNHWISDDRLMIRISMLIRLVSMGNIYMHSLVFSVVAFVVSFYCWKRVQSFFELPALVSAVAVMGLPSVLFWCSAPVKDTLIYAAVCLMVVSGIELVNGISSRWRSAVLLTVSLSLLMLLRPALAVLILGSSGIALLVCSRHRPLAIAGVAVVVAFGAVFLMSDTVAGLLINKRNELIEVALRSGAGSLTETTFRSPDHKTLQSLVPLAFRDALFHPTPFSSFGWSARLFGIEMWVLVLSVAVSLFRLPSASLGYEQRVCLVTAIFFAVSLILIVGLTTPVVGTAVRYRAVALPGLALAVVMLNTLSKNIYKR